MAQTLALILSLSKDEPDAGVGPGSAKQHFVPHCFRSEGHPV